VAVPDVMVPIQEIPAERERPRGFNLLTALLGAAIGFVFGALLGGVIGNRYDFIAGADQNDIGAFLAYLFAVIGWLAGLGFLNYPIARMFGREPSIPTEEATGVGRYFRLSTDHKVIGLQYLVGALFFFFVGGLNAMFIRAQLLAPNNTLYTPQQYISLVSIHGTMMIMIMSAALLGPLANYLVPLMIGARRMAFPRIEALSFWLVPPAGLILLSTVFMGGFPTGWTGYQPLADQARLGMDAFIMAFLLIAFALLLTGFNLLATIFTMRAPGLTWTRLPVFVWGVLTTSVLMLLSVPVLIAALALAITDRTANTGFFLAANGGSPFLWENLWWFFGHPEVYILALPGFGIVLEILPVFARKPLWGYRLAVAGMVGVMILSFMVWQHHLFVSGINADLRPFYMLTTELISIPTGFIFLNAMGTLWKGRIRYTAPMLFCLGFLFNFLIGGLSGVYLSDVPSDVSTHGSFFSMAHFHYTIMGGLVFAMFGAIYFWLPKMTGIRLSERLSKLHFWVMFVAFNSTFFPLFALGMLGMPRRVSTYNPSLQGLNDWVSISAFVLGASMLIFVYNIVRSLMFRREPAAANPWHSLGLEWQVPTPVPLHNFERVPVILSGPYEYGVPDAPPVADLQPAPAGG
jgi:cytochrome c oxidase subunit I